MDSNARSSSDLSSARRLQLISLAVFALAFAALYGIGGPPPVHPDTARDLMMARQCISHSQCYTAGPISSFRGLMNGALWIHALGAMRLLGASIRAIHLVVVALNAAAALFLFRGARSLFRPSVAVASVVVYVPLSILGTEAPVLWNPSIVQLPLVLLYLSVLLVARTGDLKFAIAAGVALALSDSHVASLALLPWLVFVIATTARRPLLGSLLNVAGFLAVEFLVSAETMLDHFRRAGSFSTFALAGILIVGALGALGRRRVAQWTYERRFAIALGSVSVMFGALMLAGAITTGHPVQARYLNTIVPAAALLTGLLIERGTSALGPRFRGVGVAGAVALLIALLLLFLLRGNLSRRVNREEWRLSDAETVARFLYGRGLSFTDIARRVRGPDVRGLVGSLGAFDPDRPASVNARNGAESTWLIVRIETRDALPAHVPSDWTVLDLRDGGVAVLREQRSYLDTHAIEMCVQAISPHGVPGTRSCASDDLSRWADPETGPDPIDRFDCALSAIRRDLSRSPALRGDGPLHWSVIVHATAPADAMAHVITTPHARRGWSLLREGGEMRTSDSVRILPGETDVRVSFERDLAAHHSGDFVPWLPDFSELADDEHALHDLLHRGVR